MKYALCRDTRPWIPHNKLQTFKHLAAQRGMSCFLYSDISLIRGLQQLKNTLKLPPTDRDPAVVKALGVEEEPYSCEGDATCHHVTCLGSNKLTWHLNSSHHHPAVLALVRNSSHAKQNERHSFETATDSHHALFAGDMVKVWPEFLLRPWSQQGQELLVLTGLKLNLNHCYENCKEISQKYVWSIFITYKYKQTDEAKHITCKQALCHDRHLC